MTTSSNPFADEPLPPAERLESAADPLNPYAAPANVDKLREGRGPGHGVWRNGELVVIHDSERLPARCIWTNQSTNRRFSLTFTYSVWWGLRGVTVAFDYSFSAAAAKRVMKNTLLAFGLAVGSILILAVNFALQVRGFPYFSWLSPIFMITMMVGFGMLLRYNSQPLTLVHHEQQYFCLRGAKEPFLRSLPNWPGLYGTNA